MSEERDLGVQHRRLAGVEGRVEHPLEQDQNCWQRRDGQDHGERRELTELAWMLKHPHVAWSELQIQSADEEKRRGLVHFYFPGQTREGTKSAGTKQRASIGAKAIADS